LLFRGDSDIETFAASELQDFLDMVEPLWEKQVENIDRKLEIAQREGSRQQLWGRSGKFNAHIFIGCAVTKMDRNPLFVR
jgi:hypothetical protein